MTHRPLTGSLLSDRISTVCLVGAIALAVVYSRSSQLELGLDSYWHAATVRAVSTTIFMGPMVAGLAAFNTSNLRAALLLKPRSRERRRIETVLAPLWAPIVIGIVTILTALAVIGWGPAMPHAEGGPDFRVIGVGFIVVGGYVGLGSIAGQVFSTTIATPLVIVTSYALTIYPRTLDNFAYRHLSGFDDTCCLNATEKAYSVLAAPVLVTAGIGALVYGIGTSRIAKRLLGALALIGAVVTAYHLVDQANADGVRPRSGSLRCNDDRSVCVWPEHAGRLAEASAAVARLHAVDSLGLPATASEAPSNWTFGFYSEATHVELLTALADGALPASPTRCISNGPPLTGLVRSLLQQWLALQAGLSIEDVRDNHSEAMVNLLTAKLAEPTASQVQWYNANLPAVRSCNVRPTDDVVEAIQAAIEAGR